MRQFNFVGQKKYISAFVAIEIWLVRNSTCTDVVLNHPTLAVMCIHYSYNYFNFVLLLKVE